MWIGIVISIVLPILSVYCSRSDDGLGLVYYICEPSFWAITTCFLVVALHKIRKIMSSILNGNVAPTTFLLLVLAFATFTFS